MKTKKIWAMLMAIMLLLSAFGGVEYNAEASSGSGQNDGPYRVVVDGEFNAPDLLPGKTISVKIPIKAVGGTIREAKVDSIQIEDSIGLIKNSRITNASGTEDKDISNTASTNSEKYVEFDIEVKDNALIKKYKTEINISYKYYKYEEDPYVEDPYAKQDAITSFDVYLSVSEEKKPVNLIVSTLNTLKASIGKETYHSIKVKNEGELIAKNVYMSLDFLTGDAANNVKNNNKKIKVGDILPGKEATVNFPISILPTATSGMKTFKLKLDYKDTDGKEDNVLGDIFIDIVGNTKAPKLEIESITYNGTINAGDKFTLVATLLNDGDSKADNIKVSIDNSSINVESFIKNYFTEDIEVESIKAGGKRNVKIPLIASKESKGGLKELKVNVRYKDSEGIERTATSTIFPDIIAESNDETSKDPFLFINNVKQSPNQPNAGGQVNLSFTVTNKGESNIKDIKLISEYVEGTFLPVSSEPYIFIENLAVGEKRLVTIPLLVSEDIKEGLNQVTIKANYSDIQGKAYSLEPIFVPILNVQNDESEISSRPKLIISRFEIDKADLKAGDTVNFTFQLKNTNSSVTANNITVTLSQKDNIFVISQGSNSFYIDKISPGETIDTTVEMKVKSDASTNTYPLSVKLDYEYEGATENPVTGEKGESKTEEINLLVIENSRPVVDYINVYSMMGMVTINENATLSFEFYNMGKSTLNNVVATIEGDFMKADGNMNFIGNVEAGNSEYVEFDVIPTIEGLAKGILKITFEDSNGDEVEMTKEFETYVEAQQIWNPDGEFPEMPELPEPKKAIIKTWQFILILVAIVSIVPFVTKAVIIAIYKRKLRNKEDY